MKKILLSLSSLALAFTANATVLTVNNTNISAGQYLTVQAAVDAASAGDTLYVHDSKIMYVAPLLNKRLVIIGAGYKTDIATNNYGTFIERIDINCTTAAASGSIFKGFQMYGVSKPMGTSDINNITIERCQINQLVIIGSNWKVLNCIVNFDIQIQYHSNILISNNLLYNIASSDKPTVLIVNNVFSHIYQGSASNNFYVDVTDATFANNIIMEKYSSITVNSGTTNVFNRNIFLHSNVSNFINYPTAGNTGSGNVNTVDPQFISNIPFTPYLYYYNYDWRLRAGAISKNYGTDGTDVGIYGGAYPNPNLSGLCPIPVVLSMDIQNTVIPVNGTLNVDFKARKQK